MGTSASPTASPTSQLVQTIFNLQDLRLRQQAADLQQKLYGLQQQQTQASIGATHEQQVAQLSQILQQTQDPQSLLPHVDELSQQTGYSTGLLKTLIQNTKPSVGTTQAGVVARGAAENPGLAGPAAYSSLVGQQPGQLAADQTQKILMDHAAGFYNSLQPGQRQQFDQEVLQRAANGKTPGEAAIDIAMSQLPKDKLKLAAEVGAGIAPSAAQDAQVRLGYAQLRQREREITAETADRMAAIQAGLEKARRDGNLDNLKEISQVIHDFSQHTANSQEKASTFTPFGKLIDNAQINVYLETIRQLRPDLYGPKGSFPLPSFPMGATMSPETFGGAVWGAIKR